MDTNDLHLEDPSPSDIQFLEERLYDFNKAATGIDDGRDLGVFIRSESGAIMAAAAGHTWGETCELRQVWVAEALRGQGFGRRLMAAAEAEAIRRGCRALFLTTHSFQAPEFYKKLSYRIIAEIADYPRGHSQLVMCKPLPSSKAHAA